MKPLAPMWRGLTALRLATKELRRAPRQGVLVVTMVSLAGAVLMAVGTVHVSQQPTAQQQIRAELGQNQAWLDGSMWGGQSVVQAPTDPRTVGTEDVEFSELGAALVDVQAILPSGTEAIPVAQGGGTVRAGDALVGAQYLAGELWRTEFAGLYDVVEGVAPVAADEVLVSVSAAELLEVTVGDSVELTSPDMTATVTGIVEQYRGSYRDFVVLTDAAMVGDRDQPVVTWYLPDLAPTWAQIQEWNTLGVVAYSRAVALDPPDVAYGPSSGSDGVAPAMLATAGIGLIALALLAGSAFSVGFRRDQRRLALLAANGASRGGADHRGSRDGIPAGDDWRRGGRRHWTRRGMGLDRLPAQRGWERRRECSLGLSLAAPPRGRRDRLLRPGGGLVGAHSRSGGVSS
ncbi:hypothetical protein LGT39_02580 [Demequina sp. TTPB684]|uniref:hypothetical protein n=1 Tax=unclassified Demequina TaxID=2620311 RepID=UPI001CF51F16|nr:MULTISPECIES: hypothetical protein [unclassified Demequina]MCB2411734.1 hypothetical protein [Demequina sp. TTPB684]UPU87597.1 hypothetical protein LGT36_010045 [Demequina sp. TMPB413]